MFRSSKWSLAISLALLWILTVLLLLSYDKLQLVDHNTGKIFCIVQTTNTGKHIKRALAVKKTWGRRCDGFLFASDERNHSLPAMKFSKSGRQYITFKMRNAYRYVYEKYGKHFDWFVKADDDTYIVMENLKHFLKTSNPNDPHYFGKPLIVHGDIYPSGSAYVMSKKALSKLVTTAYKDTNFSNCPTPRPNAHEDVDTAKCLASVGIYLEGTNDMEGKSKFLPLAPWAMLEGNLKRSHWIWKYDK